jgi:hypothetical protein
LYTLDTMIVNLADHGGKRYLRVTMALELSDHGIGGHHRKPAAPNSGCRFDDPAHQDL